jgi:hypothetical protein
VRNTRVFAVVLAPLVGLLLMGCGDAAVLDLAPLGSFLDMHVVNDTNATVTIADCWGHDCARTGDGFDDTLKPQSERDEAAWLNATSGVAAIRVTSASGAVRCLAVSYRRGQQHATRRVSQATPCRTYPIPSG